LFLPTEKLTHSKEQEDEWSDLIYQTNKPKEGEDEPPDLPTYMLEYWTLVEPLPKAMFLA